MLPFNWRLIELLSRATEAKTERSLGWLIVTLKHCSKVSRDSVVKQTVYVAASSSWRDQVVPSIVSGVCEKPFGPPVTETINLGSFIDTLKLSLPSFDDLHVSSELWSENVLWPNGVWSQASPIPSSSESSWFGLGVSGQLSSSFKIPSLSISSDRICNSNPVSLTWLLLVAFTITW